MTGCTASPSKSVLVTGATGYVGGRLVPKLLEAGCTVHALARHPGNLSGRPWSRDVSVLAGDLLDPASLPEPPPRVEAAYYLVHSMHGSGDFHEHDLRAVAHFTAWLGRADPLPHVVYLGGLLPRTGKVSKHLESRAAIGAALAHHFPVTEFRAGPIIGSGSASFEMVRYLTERLPAMIAPKWILNHVQTVAIRDVLAYLAAALDVGPSGVVEIGSEALSFRDMMKIYAAARGYRRIIVPVPVLAPTLAALWVGLVTPIPNRLAVPLVQGVIHPLLADTAKARRLFPHIEPANYQLSVRRALAKTDSDDVETRWTGALGDSAYELVDWEGMIREVRRIAVDAPPEEVFREVSSLGGARGWLVWQWAWQVRGFIDKLVGGPGLRRGRRHPAELQPGDSLDFWRVERVESPSLLRLRAEMKVPGRAWLQFEIEPGPSPGSSRLTQTAFFRPHSLPGFLYWWLLYPLHSLIFSDLVRAVGKQAEGRAHIR